MPYAELNWTDHNKTNSVSGTARQVARIRRLQPANALQPIGTLQVNTASHSTASNFYAYALHEDAERPMLA